MSATGPHHHSARRRAFERALVHVTGLAGAFAVIVVIAVVVVFGLGPTEDANLTTALLVVVAATLAAGLAGPVRRRLETFANQRVYGEARAPADALRTFSSRMTRSIPMEELLRQLAESLRASMDLTSAEIWTGSAAELVCQVAVPHRPTRTLALAPEERLAAARAGVRGNAWLQVWLPALLADKPERAVRVAPIAHLGELLGLIVVDRPDDARPFTDSEEEVLTDLARQVGLALHNVGLDTALQASLAELTLRNEELQRSRLRIVAAADESRRALERDLHDGAQQHLVAMAVRIGLAAQVVGTDPERAAALLEALRRDVQDTVDELRELAHGIYPPLLRDRGLDEALRAAMARRPMATVVRVQGAPRPPMDLESAIYFCCLEAVQNASKYAGDEAEVRIDIEIGPDTVRFEVADDGTGFDVAHVIEGHGITNMRDRIGAVGGVLAIESGRDGTTVRGSVAVAPNPQAPRRVTPDGQGRVATPTRDPATPPE